MKKINYLIISFLILILISLTGGCSTGGEKTDKTVEQIIESQEIHSLGEEANIGNIYSNTIEVCKSDHINGDDGNIYYPARGNVFIFITLYIRNDTDGDLTISREYVDAYADNTLVSISPYLDQMHPSFPTNDSLGSGNKVAGGYLLFEVPENFQEFELDYKPDEFSNGKMKFLIPSDQLIMNQVITAPQFQDNEKNQDDQ